jgi:hypothetical protein
MTIKDIALLMNVSAAKVRTIAKAIGLELVKGRGSKDYGIRDTNRILAKLKKSR